MFVNLAHFSIGILFPHCSKTGCEHLEGAFATLRTGKMA